MRKDEAGSRGVYAGKTLTRSPLMWKTVRNKDNVDICPNVSLFRLVFRRDRWFTGAGTEVAGWMESLWEAAQGLPWALRNPDRATRL